MGKAAKLLSRLVVALRTEGVDRNSAVQYVTKLAEVALRTEGVDRNFGLFETDNKKPGRPPHGGRG